MSFRKWQLIMFVVTYAVFGLRYGWASPPFMLGFWLAWAMNCIVFYFPVTIVAGIFKPSRMDEFVELERRLRDAA